MLKSELHSQTIAEVQLSTFNYKTGQHMLSNCRNRQTGQIWTLGGFQGGFVFVKELKKFKLDKRNQN